MPTAVHSSRSSAIPQPSAALASGEYRRQARRLRGVYAGQPLRLHRGLRDLSRMHDRATFAVSGPTANSPGPVPARVSVVATPRSRESHAFARVESRSAAQWFADHVTAELNGQILRYSQRLALLKTAARLGIGRFEANLIIAAAQHAHDGCRTPARSIQPKTPWEWAIPLTVLALVQGAIVCGVWWVFHAM